MIKLFLLQLVIALSLSACATSESTSSGASAAEPDLDFRGSDCILIRTIRDYTTLDRQHLLIHGLGNRAYYVKLFRPSFGMTGGIGMRVESRDDQLCPFGGDSIVFGSFGDERVRVQSISRLTAEQEEYLLERYGLSEPDEQQAPASPPEVKGAEVEELG